MASRVALLAPFASRGFAGLWVSASSGSFGRVVTQLAFSWLALEATGSPFLVGVVSAVRMVPQLVLGIPAGALADWVDRRRLVMGVNAVTVLVLLALIPLAGFGLLTPAVLIVVAALYGTLDTVRSASTQSYAYDLVRTSRANSGMALMNLGVQMLSLVGGLVGGYVLDRYGASATFAVVASAMLVAALAPAIGGRRVGDVDEAAAPSEWHQLAHTTRPGQTQQSATPEASGSAVATSVVSPRTSTRSQAGAARRRGRPDFAGAAKLLLHNRLLATLALGIVLAEIFGFATQTLLPTFARDVFDVGASGLGTMYAFRSGGGALGLLVLAWIGAEGRSGRLFVTGATLFGLALLLFAQAPGFSAALVMLALSGMCASVMDTLGQTLMQRNAAEHQRGAAMGMWVFSVGFGPVGHLTLGAGATVFGAPAAQTVSGFLLMIVGLLLSLNRRLRRAE